MENNEILQRITLYRQQQGMSQARLARALGIDPSNISKLMKGQLPVTDSFINRMVVELGLSKAWLVKGEGPVMAEALRASGTPVYDIDITAGGDMRTLDFTDDRIIGYVQLPEVSQDSCLVRVSGDSMEPVVKNGAWVAVRPVNVKPPFFWGQIYSVVLDDYRMLKFLRKDKADRQGVILHSANPNYDDIEVKIADIRRLFIVETILNVDLRVG